MPILPLLKEKGKGLKEREMEGLQSANVNAHRPTLRLDLTVTSGATPG